MGSTRSRASGSNSSRLTRGGAAAFTASVVTLPAGGSRRFGSDAGTGGPAETDHGQRALDEQKESVEEDGALEVDSGTSLEPHHPGAERRHGERAGQRHPAPGGGASGAPKRHEGRDALGDDQRHHDQLEQQIGQGIATFVSLG